VFVLGAFMIATTLGAACGGSSSGNAEVALKIALLVPGTKASRNESLIPINFESRVGDDCGECEVISSDAAGKSSRQVRQAEAALRQGADVLVFKPVSSKRAGSIVRQAEDQGVPVVVYGQPVDEAAPDAFVSFDRVAAGELQAEALSRKLEKGGRASGPIVMLYGGPGNRDQRLLRGARRGFRSAGVEIAKRYSLSPSDVAHAKQAMEDAIAALGRDGFAGVYAETDGIAEGAIAALKMAGISPAERPTTGAGSTLAGVRRIIAGRQYSTIYEPVESEAAVSAAVAAGLASGAGIPKGKVRAELDSEATAELVQERGELPSVLIEPVAVTKANVKRTVIADDLFSASELCGGGGNSCARWVRHR
jgi:D-xylose transport system substrate-binding protein